jgi:hypothetical protein
MLIFAAFPVRNDMPETARVSWCDKTPFQLPRPHSPSIFAVSLSRSSATGTKPLKSLGVLLLLYRRKSQGLSRGSSRPGSVHAELQDWIAKAVAEGESRRVGCAERAVRASKP